MLPWCAYSLLFRLHGAMGGACSVSKIQAAKQREAKQRGDAQRAKSLERARTNAYSEHPELSARDIQRGLEIAKERGVLPELPWEEGKAEPEAIRKAREASELNGVVRPAMTRWEAQKAQAKREGFRNAWAMRVAKRKPGWPHSKPIAEHKRTTEIEEAGPQLASQGLNVNPKQRAQISASQRFWQRYWTDRGLDPPDYDERFDRKYGEVVQHVKDGRPLTERGAELVNRPQPVVVSPPFKPLYSLQTKPGVDSNKLSPAVRGES